jgi:hypothetical protein
MACARWHHAAPTGLAEISVRAGYKHVAPLGLVSFGGRPPAQPVIIQIWITSQSGVLSKRPPS